MVLGVVPEQLDVLFTLNEELEDLIVDLAHLLLGFAGVEHAVGGHFADFEKKPIYQALTERNYKNQITNSHIQLKLSES